MIYLIKNKNFLKIGYSQNIENRLKEYKTHNPDYELIAIREGNKDFETFLHKRFKEFKIRNEWFLYKDIIVDDFLNFSNEEFNYPKAEDVRHIFTFPETLTKLLELKSGKAYDLLTFLCVNSDFNTGQIEFSSELRKKAIKILNQSTNVITNNLKLLETYKLIKRLPSKIIKINPKYIWKGDLNVKNQIIFGIED